MKKTILVLTFASMSSAAFGAAGIFDSFLFTSTDGASPDVFYDIGASSGNPDFDGADLGTFGVGDTLQIGGQQKSYKNNSTDVTAHSLFYTIDGGSPYQTVGLNWQKELATAGDQQWGGDVQGGNANFTVSSDILSGLSAGNHMLTVYSTITTNGNNADGTIYNNNGAKNYTASFTVTAVPEPSSAALLGLGGLALMFRRRK